MKIKNGFVVRKVGGQNVAVATGELSKQFHGMIRLNETGTFLWTILSSDTTEDELVTKLLAEYEIDEPTARADVKKFLSSLSEVGALEV